MATDSVTAFLSKVLQAKRNRKNTSCRCPEMCVDPGDLGSTDAHGRPLEDYGLLPVELRHLGNLWLWARGRTHNEGFHVCSPHFVQFQLVHWTLLDSLMELHIIEGSEYDVELTFFWVLYLRYYGEETYTHIYIGDGLYVEAGDIDELYLPVKKCLQRSN